MCCTVAARGKTHVSRSIERYLRWLGVKTEGELSRFEARRRLVLMLVSVAVFSLGDHRRKVLGPSSTLPPDYFTPIGRTDETQALRMQVIASLELEVENFFKENRGQVAIYDANVRSPLPAPLDRCGLDR